MQGASSRQQELLISDCCPDLPIELIIAFEALSSLKKLLEDTNHTMSLKVPGRQANGTSGSASTKAVILVTRFTTVHLVKDHS